MSNRVSRRQLLRMTGPLAVGGLLAACAAPPSSAPAASNSASAATAAPAAASPTDAPASGGDKVMLKWDTFRGPGTGWNEERIRPS